MSMDTSTIRTLIALQFKAGVRLKREKNALKTTLRWSAIILVSLALLGGFIAVYYLLAGQFVNEKGTAIDLRHPFLIFTITGFMVVQTVFLIPMLMKVLNINNDRELLCKLPITSNQIFISKIIVAYLIEIIFAAAVLGPLLIAYGLAASVGFVFYLLMPLVIVLVPVIPFCLATLLIFPLIKFMNFLRGRAWLTTLLYLGMLIGGVLLYTSIVRGMVFTIADQGFSQTLEGSAGAIRGIASYMYPPRIFSGILDGDVGTVFFSIGLCIVVSAVFLAIAYIVAKWQYKKIYLDEQRTISKNTRKKLFGFYKPTTALLGKDTKNIFRSSNYTFQFLLVVVITPLLVFFSNRLAGYAVYTSFDRVGETDLSMSMVFEISLLVIMVLIPIASSFAASNISREGHNIYHTKMIPVSFRKQLLVKTGIVFVPIFLSILLSCLLTMLSNAITPTHILPGLGFGEVLTLFTISVSMAITYICLGTYLDLRKPLCSQVGSSELTKSTASTNFVMLLGVVIGFFFGVLALLSVFGSVIQVGLSPAVCRTAFLVCSIASAVTFLAVLFVDGPKKYYKLEQ